MEIAGNSKNMTLNQRVLGSSPSASTIVPFHQYRRRPDRVAGTDAFAGLLKSGYPNS